MNCESRLPNQIPSDSAARTVLETLPADSICLMTDACSCGASPGVADVDMRQVWQDRAVHDGASAAGPEPLASPLGQL